MKIFVNNIPQEGLFLEENASASALDLDTDFVKVSGLVNIKAGVSKITNAVSVALELFVPVTIQCSRCLVNSQREFKKNVNLHYPVDKLQQVIELNDDIRQEIIIDYPLKPLCKSDCKGLCSKCGKNLNQGACGCKVG